MRNLLYVFVLVITMSWPLQSASHNEIPQGVAGAGAAARGPVGPSQQPGYIPGQQQQPGYLPGQPAQSGPYGGVQQTRYEPPCDYCRKPKRCFKDPYRIALSWVRSGSGNGYCEMRRPYNTRAFEKFRQASRDCDPCAGQATENAIHRLKQVNNCGGRGINFGAGLYVDLKSDRYGSGNTCATIYYQCNEGCRTCYKPKPRRCEYNCGYKPRPLKRFFRSIKRIFSHKPRRYRGCRTPYSRRTCRKVTRVRTRKCAVHRYCGSGSSWSASIHAQVDLYGN